MLADLGLTVARNIPVETWAGIATGLYKLQGGVVRDLSGRIIAHLALPASTALSAVPGLGLLGSAMNTASIYGLSQDVAKLQATANQLLNLSIATTALSGLNLVVSIAGFAFLIHQVKQVEARLVRMEKQTKEIRQILNSSHRAQLLAAIDTLSQSRDVKDPHMRQDLLMQGKLAFSTLAHHYKSMWAESADVIDLDATEEHFTLAIMGAALCTSDLGMPDIAASEAKRHVDDWRMLAKRHCGKTLLRGDPERLLHHRYVKSLPTSEILLMLDFVNGTERGVEWLDELRERQGKSPMISMPTAATESGPIEFAKKLRAKDEVLQGYVSHFEFLAPKKLRASDFTSEVAALTKANGDGPLWISERIPATG